eukprot:765722-Hanusia_phi.AAC.1
METVLRDVCVETCVKLGIAGKPLLDMRESEVLRALRSNKVIVVFDDWQALREEARLELSCFFKKLPANWTLPYVVSQCNSLAVRRSMDMLKKCNIEFLSVAVPNIKGSDAQRMFYLHMERCKYGESHHPEISFENPFVRTGQCRFAKLFSCSCLPAILSARSFSQLGNLSAEDFEALKAFCGSELGYEGEAHVLATMMLAACASESSVQECIMLYQ